jgi:radical SAM superfamily enzyme
MSTVPQTEALILQLANRNIIHRLSGSDQRERVLETYWEDPEEEVEAFASLHSWMGKGDSDVMVVGIGVGTI